MAKTIYKYPLQIADQQTVAMPEGAEILTVQVQHNTPCLWALVDPQAPRRERTILIHGTGHPVNQAGRYVGTFQMGDDSLVFHVFEKKETR